MGMTPGTTQQAQQGLAGAAQGMIAQDQIQDRKDARLDAANQADIARKDAQAKLTMQLEHQSGMQQNQITADENMQSSQFAENLLARQDAAKQQGVQNEWQKEQNTIQQRIMFLMQKQQRDDFWKMKEYQRGLVAAAPTAGGGGGGGGTMNYSARTFAGQSSPTTGYDPQVPAASQYKFGASGGIGGPGQWFSPEQREENRMWNEDATRQLGNFWGQQRIAMANYASEWGDVADKGAAMDQFTNKLVSLYDARLRREERFGNELTAVNTGMFAPGGDIISLVTQSDPSRISGGHKMGKTMDTLLFGGAVTGGGVPGTKPLERVEDLPLHQEFEDSEHWYGRDDTFQEAVQGTESDAMQSALTIAREKYGMTDAEFSKAYKDWADPNDENQIRSYQMGTFGETSSEKGFNNYLAMELASRAGHDVDENLLQGARDLIGATKINPLLSAESLKSITWGQEEMVGFTAASSEQVQTLVLNRIANEFETNFPGVGETLKKVAPMLVQYANTSTGTPKEKEEATKKIMAVFAENQGAHFQPIMQIMSSFHDQRENLGNMIFSDDTRKQLSDAVGGDEKNLEKAIGALETGYDGLANLSTVFNTLTGAGQGDATSVTMLQGALQAVGAQGLSGQTHVNAQGVQVNTLKPEWEQQMYQVLVENGDPSLPLEIREQRLALLFEAASTARTHLNTQLEEARAAIDPVRESYEDQEFWFDNVVSPYQEKRIAKGQRQGEQRWQDFKTEGQASDADFENEFLDILTGGTTPTKP